MKIRFLSIMMTFVVLWLSFLPDQTTAQAFTITAYGSELWKVDFNSQAESETLGVKLYGESDYSYESKDSKSCLKLIRSDANAATTEFRIDMSEQRRWVDYSTSISKADLVLEIRVYLNDQCFFKTGSDFSLTGQIEMTSSGEPDEQKWTKDISRLNVTTGAWNTIQLPLSGYDKVDPEWVYGKLRFFRIWLKQTGGSLGESARTAYFDYVRLVWYPSKATGSQSQRTAYPSESLLGYSSGSNDAVVAERTIYQEHAGFFDPENPNQLLLADFRGATVSAGNNQTLTGVKSIGANKYYKNIDSDTQCPATVEAKVTRGTFTTYKKMDPHNFLYTESVDGVSDVQTDTAARPMPAIEHEQFAGSGTRFGWRIRVNFGDYVDLSRYSRIHFSFWMTNYHLTNINGKGAVVVGTPGSIQMTLMDTANGFTEDGVTVGTFDLATSEYDPGNNNAITNGHTFTSQLYTWYYQSGSGTEDTTVAAKNLSRHLSSDGQYLISSKYVDGISLRFYVSDNNIQAAPTIMLGQVWADCDNDTFESSCAVSESDNRLDNQQVTYMQQKPADYDPLTNWDGKQGNKVVTVADWHDKKRIFVDGVVFGDYQFSVANNTWPWRYQASSSPDQWSGRTAFCRGGNYGAVQTRKDDKWLTYTGRRTYGGTNATAASGTVNASG